MHDNCYIMTITVYLIEDDPDFGRAMLHTLKAAHMLTVAGWACTLKEARADLERDAHDIYLLDINLPDGDGLDFMKEIQSRSPDAKIMIMSALGSSKHITQSLKSGATGFLLKSEMPNDIVSNIINIINGGVYLGSHVGKLLIEKMTRTSELNFSHPIDIQRSKKADYLSLTGPHITPKELEVLFHLENGSSAKIIGHELGISIFTVNQHLRNIYRKLNARNKMEAINLAKKSGLLGS